MASRDHSLAQLEGLIALWVEAALADILEEQGASAPNPTNESARMVPGRKPMQALRLDDAKNTEPRD